jgi:hypothetical protein
MILDFPDSPVIGDVYEAPSTLQLRNKSTGRFPCVPRTRYRYVMLLLYQADVRKRGEAILGAGPQPRLRQEEREGRSL